MPGERDNWHGLWNEVTLTETWDTMGYNGHVLSKNWCLVSYDWEGDPVQWCGHRHESAQEAHDCPWKPEDPDEILSITIVSDFDASALEQCVHLEHPAECERCLEWICIHLQHPWECERCLWYARGEYDYAASDGSIPDHEGGVGQGEDEGSDPGLVRGVAS